MTSSEILINILTKGDPRGADQVTESLTRIEETANRVGKELSLKLTAPIAAAFGVSFKLAADAQETYSKFSSVFAERTAEMDRWAKELTNTLPETQTAIRGMAAEIQDLLVPLGVAPDAAADLTKRVVELAGDLASFNNLPFDDAMARIRSGLVGQYEPLLKFGVALNATTVKAEALRLGLIAEGEELDANARAQASLALIVQGTAAAHGDAAKTVDSAANKIKAFRTSVTELSESLGAELIPILQPAIETLTTLIDGFGDLDDSAKKAIVVLGLLAASAGPLALIVGTGAKVVKVLIAMNVQLAAMGTAGKLAAAGIGRAGLYGALLGLGAAIGTATDQAIGFSDAIGRLVIPSTYTLRGMADDARIAIRRLIEELSEGDDGSEVYAKINVELERLNELKEDSSGEDRRTWELAIAQLETEKRRLDLTLDGTLARREAAKEAERAAAAAEAEAKAQESINGILLKRTAEQKEAFATEAERINILRLRAKGLDQEADAIERAIEHSRVANEYAQKHGLTLEGAVVRLREIAGLEAQIAERKRAAAEEEERRRQAESNEKTRIAREDIAAQHRINLERIAGNEDVAKSLEKELAQRQGVRDLMEQYNYDERTATLIVETRLALRDRETKTLKDQKTELERLTEAAEAAGANVGRTRLAGKGEQITINGQVVGNQADGLNTIGTGIAKSYLGGSDVDQRNQEGLDEVRDKAAGRSSEEKAASTAKTAAKATVEAQTALAEVVTEGQGEMVAAVQDTQGAFEAYSKAVLTAIADLRETIKNQRT